MKAIVTGMIATYPVGGVAWDYGQYALGLERLGFDVYYLEDTGWQTYDPNIQVYGEDCTYGVGFLEEALRCLSPTLGDRWHFRAMDGQGYGLPSGEIEDVIAGADIFLNVSGGTLLRDEYMRSARKVFIDTDPGWNHFVNFPKWDKSPGWQDTHGYRSHDHFFTYAELIGRPGCGLPKMGIDWHTTRPPVVMDCWKMDPPGESWTTVMTWDNFRQPIEYEGKTYGTKEREFSKIETLPSLSDASFEIAVGGAEPPIDHWRALGWSVLSSEAVSRTIDDYRTYIQSSRGEFSVAKNVYVAPRSGWFSCRSVCYLAAGRPVVLQDTGFSEVLSTGHGLLNYSNLEEAKQAINQVEADYAAHQEAALGLAYSLFGADVVLSDMLDNIGLG